MLTPLPIEADLAPDLGSTTGYILLVALGVVALAVAIASCLYAWINYLKLNVLVVAILTLVGIGSMVFGVSQAAPVIEVNDRATARSDARFDAAMVAWFEDNYGLTVSTEQAGSLADGDIVIIKDGDERLPVQLVDGELISSDFVPLRSTP